MNHKSILTCLLLSISCFLALSQNIHLATGGEFQAQSKISCTVAEQRDAIDKQIKKNILDLGIAKTYSGSRNATVVNDMIWPLEWNGPSNYANYYVTINFVDLKAEIGSGSFNQFGDSNLDYECGQRSYDTQSGYNHSGVDLTSWPFSTRLKDEDYVHIVAAQAGTIVLKNDGFADDNCSTCGAGVNIISLMHEDGSQTMYFHMKKNSLTSKTLGSYVAQGEYLGVVGSSGCSSEPHLHFEVRDSDNQVVEPFAGPCNETIGESLWRDQRPYRSSTLNAVLTHSAPPEFGCNTSSENPNLSGSFDNGETVYIASYYVDQQTGDITTYRIFAPDGSQVQSWEHVSPATYLNSYWFFTVPTAGSQCGTWTVQVEYKDQIIRHSYNVGSVPNLEISTEDDLSICRGEILTLEASSSDDVTYEWSDGSTTSSIEVNDGGTFTITATDASGCMVVESVEVQVSEIPTQSAISGSFQSTGEGTESYVVFEADPTYTYQWEVTNGTILNGQGSREVDVQWDVNVEGKICVTATNTSGCTSIQSCENVSTMSTSTTSLGPEEVRIFPNPFSERIVITGSGLNTIIKIQVFSSLGEMVYVNVSSSPNSISLQMPVLASGIYYVKIANLNTHQVYKILKR